MMVADARRLSVVIVSYECRELLSECLRSLRDALSASDEIIVVDNASSDGTGLMLRESFPDVRAAINGSNLGFATAVNIGVREARSRLTMI